MSSEQAGRIPRAFGSDYSTSSTDAFISSLKSARSLISGLKEARLARLAECPGFRFCKADLADSHVIAALFREITLQTDGPDLEWIAELKMAFDFLLAKHPTTFRQRMLSDQFFWEFVVEFRNVHRR